MAENPMFNLDEIVGKKIPTGGGEINFRPKKKQIQAGTHSTNPDNYSDILKDYVEVPMSSLNTLQQNDLVKYINTEGVLKHTGKIKMITTEPDNSYTFVLTAFSGKNGIRWSINSRKIKQMYKYIQRDEPPKNKVVRFDGLEDDDNVKNKILALEARIQTLENALKNVIQHINSKDLS